MPETRQEHLEWCKQRALEYLTRDDVAMCFASFISDMSKHPETKHHAFLPVGASLFANGHLNSVAEMRRHVEGYN